MKVRNSKKTAIVLVFITLLFVSLTGCNTSGISGKPILIQGHGAVETQILMDALEKPTQETVGGITYHKGTIDGYPVIVVDQCVGVINAAGATAAAIMQFDPYCVINQGTAGGHDPNLNRYDVVLGEQVVYINFIYTEMRDKGEGMHAEDWGLGYYRFKTDSIKDPQKPLESTTSGGAYDGTNVKLEYVPSDAHLMEIAESVSGNYSKGKVVRGVIGSGDAWNREIDRIEAIHEQFGTSSEDMETFATAFICQYHEVPFLGVRVISNSEVAGDANREFKPEAGEDLQNHILDITRAIIADTTKK